MNTKTEVPCKPWHIDFRTTPGHFVTDTLIRGKNREVIANIHVHSKITSHLIAAVPKMIEALENLENDNNQIPEHAWKMVQEAIKQARGETDGV